MNVLRHNIQELYTVDDGSSFWPIRYYVVSSPISTISQHLPHDSIPATRQSGSTLVMVITLCTKTPATFLAVTIESIVRFS